MKTPMSRPIFLLALIFLLISCSWMLAQSVSIKQKDRSTSQARSAAEIFEKNCATCHGRDGRAKTFKSKFIHTRNFTDAAWQASVSDDQLFNSISHGKGKMPAWKDKLSEAEIKTLVAYTRKFKN